jgi:4-carboxymuconolactone decarboxylase
MTMKPLVAVALAVSLLDPALAAEPELFVERAGARQTQQGAPERFIGLVTVDMLKTPFGEQRASAGSVTFAPGAHTAWHTHPLGQTLIVTRGTGLVQRWGSPIEEIRPGDVVHIGPGVKHWHGASPGTSMTHIAIQEAQDGRTVDWLERVSDAQYPQPPSPTERPPTAPSRAQQLMGDVAPKLAQLTDDVLFGDVWNRPGLSQRDRSLVTVSALIALNRPEQLRSHMTLALQNGVTEGELVEVLTHLAFYAGWPNAVTATGVAREVFQGAKH